MMFAPDEILSVWRKFDEFPMETLTKAWFYDQAGDRKQRDISLMQEHHQQYGISGNCFDLAIWLLAELKKAGVEAYPIGHHFKTDRAHAAVIALDERGRRFLCDLGDQWLNPILIDSGCEDYTEEKLSGFFPAAKVQVKPSQHQIEITYHRPSGKIVTQAYDPEPVDENIFLEAAEYSQRRLKPEPLVECRVPYQNETAHWEFSGWSSHLSTSNGLDQESKPKSIEGWADKIQQMTGYDKHVLLSALTTYQSR
ncbi:hypothetical protein ACINLE_19175 [Bacillus sp. z60-18]|uniref:hypothetical protein n=1 Tax=Bacillus TaxID=1386 RepID=UPI00098B407A|nr:hypothetical protein [Bacillus sonorensis]